MIYSYVLYFESDPTMTALLLENPEQIYNFTLILAICVSKLLNTC